MHKIIYLLLVVILLISCAKISPTENMTTAFSQSVNSDIEIVPNQDNEFIESTQVTIPMESVESIMATNPVVTTEPTVPTEVIVITEPIQSTEPTEVTTATEPTEPIQFLYTKEDYTLKRGYRFYQGSEPISNIQSIVFTKNAPQTYEEKWSASATDADCLMGYRDGKKVFIVGEQILASWDCKYMFAGHNSYGNLLWNSLTNIDGLELIDTSQAKDMKLMFAFSKVKKLSGIGGWNVSRVQDFSAMFQGHDNSGDVPFIYLDVANWDTSSARSMSHMFYGCAQLTSIPVDNWDVSNVGSFSHMFADCYNLQSLNLANWHTDTVVSFDAFLNDCHSLIQIDVSTLNTSACRQFSQMFEACVNLEEIIGINNWDVSNANYYAFSETFHCCYKLKRLDLSNWVATPDNTARMFKNCYNLEFIDISGLDLSQVKTDLEMYDGCENLKIS